MSDTHVTSEDLAAWEKTRSAARGIIAKLSQADGHVDIDDARAQTKKLRDNRDFDLLDQLAEELRASGQYDPAVITFQAQSLIERGKPFTALDLLEALLARRSVEGDALVELRGLMGRAWKQVFFDRADKTSSSVVTALEKSLSHYRLAYDAKPGGSVWAALNLIALADFIKREHIPVACDIDVTAMAKWAIGDLDKTKPEKRDNWFHASLAEAYLGLGDLNAVEAHIGEYVRSNDTTAFALGGTLRQFTDLWQLHRRDERGRGIIEALRASLLRHKSYGRLELTPAEVQQTLAAPKLLDSQLQKILGAAGLRTYEWLLTGLTKARSVGVIRQAEQGRRGTGFLVRAGDLLPNLGNELVVMTNAHVVSNQPEDRAVAPEECKISFEAVTNNHPIELVEILWHSPKTRLDCVLVRLKQQPEGIAPLELATDLPRVPLDPSATRPQVFIIGYPGGRDLTFSLQDNALLDHEGPTEGKPPDPAVCRVQYRAPTEPGSSGSPVFNSSLWRVIALHHAGDTSMPRLNGAAGTWPANEGIWIQSIVKAAAGGA